MKYVHSNELIAVITEAVIMHLRENRNTKKLHINEEIIQSNRIPIGISNRHVHLSSEDMRVLFGHNAVLTKISDLSQPGQFASEQRLTLVGQKGVIENVRVLGPCRNKTQVEISVSDCIRLGVQAPIRDSGDLQNSAGVTLVGPIGSITLREGVIIAARHVHMDLSDAEQFRVKDGDRINVKVPGPRGLVFYEVLVRANDKFRLEMHIDIDEANAASLKNGDHVEIATNTC